MREDVMCVMSSDCVNLYLASIALRTTDSVGHATRQLDWDYVLVSNTKG